MWYNLRAAERAHESKKNPIYLYTSVPKIVPLIDCFGLQFEEDLTEGKSCDGSR